MDRPTPVVTHLTGTQRGRTQRLTGDRLRIGPASDADVRVYARDLSPEALPPLEREPATVERRGQTYELKAPAEAGIYVNGRKVEYVVLDSGDLVEVGPGGPALRFRVYRPGQPPNKSVREVVEDCVDGARYSTRNPVRRAGIFLARAPRELATQTTRLFRIAVVVMLALLVVVVGYLWTEKRQLERRLEVGSARIQSLDELLSRTEQESLTEEDLAVARAAIEERVEALEERQGARMRVIAQASPSVVFLQGSYGFVDADSDRPLRFVEPVESDSMIPGRPPPVTLEGSGPEVEVLYTGTAFIVSREGDLITNRHVAVPWDFDAAAKNVVSELGLVPVARRFIGYLPGSPEPFDVEPLRVSDTHDLAILRCAELPEHAVPLPIGEAPPRIGDEVIVLGYPTGMRGLVVRADPAFVEELMADDSVDFWTAARRLAAENHIAPLATVGVVGQVTASSVVYDADTTSGGSGGPVLDLDGRVVAINAAVLPEFGGSNLGVPASEAVRLLDR